MRGLAEAGRALWVKLFKHERTSALFRVGEWLESHPLAPDGVVQVSADSEAASFVFPWSLLYNRRLPRKKYELPDPKVFGAYVIVLSRMCQTDLELMTHR